MAKGKKVGRQKMMEDVMGLRNMRRKKVVRTVKIGAAAVVVTLSPMILFGCAVKSGSGV